MEVKEIRNRINKDVTFGRKPQGEQRGEDKVNPVPGPA